MFNLEKKYFMIDCSKVSTELTPGMKSLVLDWVEFEDNIKDAHSFLSSIPFLVQIIIQHSFAKVWNSST